MPAPKGSGDSTTEKSCLRFTSSIVGVDWLCAQKCQFGRYVVKETLSSGLVSDLVLFLNPA